MILLETKDLTKKFGGLTAVGGLNFSIEAGEISSVIGPNGAGKTTFFNLLTGVYQPDGGDINLLGERVNGRSPAWIIFRGVARTFQNIRLFNKMTVLENVMVGRHCRTRSELFSAMFRTPAFYREENEIVRSAQDRLKFVGLLDRANELAGSLPYGDQRKLEIARALATEPRLLLLDEPTAGMNQSESVETVGLIQRIQKEGVTVLLIEHRMSVVMKISKRVHVLDHGIKIAEGSPSEIQSNPQVIEAYLGAGQEPADIASLGHS